MVVVYIMLRFMSQQLNLKIGGESCLIGIMKRMLIRFQNEDMK